MLEIDFCFIEKKLKLLRQINLFFNCVWYENRKVKSIFVSTCNLKYLSEAAGILQPTIEIPF